MDWQAIIYWNSLIKDAQAALPMSDGALAEEIVNSFCSLISSTWEPSLPPFASHLIKSPNGGLDGGISRKSGNVILNWKRLFRDAGESTGDVYTTIDHPLFLVVAAIKIWVKVRKLETIKLTSEQSVSFYVMWIRCDLDNRIAFNTALAETNKYLVNRKRPPMNAAKFTDALNSLESIHSIEIEPNDMIFLRESYKSDY